MKLNLQKNLVTSTIFCSLLTVVPSVLAQTFDYSLLIGEWSAPGMCDEERYVYTANGRYLLLEKAADDPTWQTVYEGVYVVKPELEAVVIAEGMNMGGFIFKTIKLNDTTYRSLELEDPYTSREDDKSEISIRERCGNR